HDRGGRVHPRLVRGARSRPRRGGRVSDRPKVEAAESRMRALASELREIEGRIRAGGGEARTARQHAQGKLTARERVALLLDPRSRFQEIGLLLAHDQYEGEAPGAGVVTGVGSIAGREVVV